jgi:hypothetical protein
LLRRQPLCSHDCCVIVVCTAVCSLNQLTPPKTTPEIIKFLLQFTNPLMALLLVAGALTFMAYGIQSPRDKNNAILAAALIIVVTLTCVMSYLQERSASNLMGESPACRAAHQATLLAAVDKSYGARIAACVACRHPNFVVDCLLGLGSCCAQHCSQTDLCRSQRCPDVLLAPTRLCCFWDCSQYSS